MTYEAKQPIYLPWGDFLDLEFHLMDTKAGITPEAFVMKLVQRWLAVEKERLALLRSGAATRGFQWKNIFLPDGTRLRTSHRDSVEFAKVAGEHIVAEDGTTLTPSIFANRHAKGRNAWRFVWLRFPGDDYWIRADQYRSRFESLQIKRAASKMAAP